MKDSLNIAIAGATGYVGVELIKILLKHPKVKILYLCANKSLGKKNFIFYKKFLKKKLPKLTKIKNIDFNKVDVLFSSLPNGESQNIALTLPRHVKLIDLSADFRLKDFKLYKKWYGINHKSKHLMSKSKYAVTEFSKKNLNNYNIISCPGCYPTSIQLPLIPLIKKKMINVNNIIVDSKSGFSGGGKNVEKKFKNINIHNSVSAYGVGAHRHMAEIDQELSIVAKKKIKITFTPHLIPMFRGILSTIYIETLSNYNAIKIHNFLKNYHKKNFFIKVLKFNTPLSTHNVINTNFCNISVCQNRDSNKVIIVSAIDNLIKGASGQAIQNMNVAYKFKETTGLI